MSRGSNRKVLKVYFDAEEREYVTYLPDESLPDPARQPEMQYVGEALEGVLHWQEIDKLIQEHAVKHGIDLSGGKREGRG